MSVQIFKGMEKAIIFDFDGTLADTIPSIWAEYQRVMEVMGLPKITHRTFTQHVGRTWEDIIRTFWPGIDPQEFTRNYRIGSEEVKPFPGVHEAISVLRTRYRLSIMTARGGTIGEWIARTSLDESAFESVWHKEMLRYNKPDPRALLQVCEGLRLEPVEAIYVGDSVIDARCALDAGLRFIGVLSGGGYIEDFKEAGVADVIPSVAQIPSLLERGRD
jgi:phosphoglycolate phosphatase-like HAD superfamily hydrolase